MWRYLLDQGYSPSKLRPIFQHALENKKVYSPTGPTLDPFPDHWFFKIPFHPQDPSLKKIQRAWRRNIAIPLLSKPLELVDCNYTPLGLHRFIICYNRAPNLGNLLTYRKLLPDSGPPVSSFL